MGQKQAKWAEKVDAAKPLARFADLKPGEEKQFQADNPNFMPAEWWGYRTTSFDGSSVIQWQTNQQFLRDAWDEWRSGPLSQTRLMQLLLSVFDPSNVTVDIIGSPLKPKDWPRYAEPNQLPDEMYPYQEAVLFLNSDHWRAMSCHVCHKRFVANSTQSLHCGNDCAALTARETKLETYRKHAAEYNRRKRRKRAREQ